MNCNIKKQSGLGCKRGLNGSEVGCSFRVPFGEVSEWFKEHAWKACVRRKAYRGFESLSLRHLSLFEQRIVKGV